MLFLIFGKSREQVPPAGKISECPQSLHDSYGQKGKPSPLPNSQPHNSSSVTSDYNSRGRPRGKAALQTSVLSLGFLFSTHFPGQGKQNVGTMTRTDSAPVYVPQSRLGIRHLLVSKTPTLINLKMKHTKNGTDDDLI